jgi:hypothetical protein
VDHALPAALPLGSIRVNPVSLLGHVLTLVLALIGLKHLLAARAAVAGTVPGDFPADVDDVMGVKIRLTDLAVLSFIASMAFMALEMVAGRLVTRHLGSSLYGWTSVIAIMLGGLSLGNFLGGKIADRVR